MRQACGIETHGLAYRPKFLQSYREAILEKVRPRRQPHGSIYEEDYQPTATLTRLAQDHNVAIVVVHPMFKGSG